MDDDANSLRFSDLALKFSPLRPLHQTAGTMLKIFAARILVLFSLGTLVVWSGMIIHAPFNPANSSLIIAAISGPVIVALWGWLFWRRSRSKQLSSLNSSEETVNTLRRALNSRQATEVADKYVGLLKAIEKVRRDSGEAAFDMKPLRRLLEESGSNVRPGNEVPRVSDHER